MLSQIVINLTKRTVYVAGLVWAAEYAMLALIEDSPQILKAATLVCAIGGLALLESYDHVRHRHLKVFWAAVGLVVSVYIGFVAYALCGVYYSWHVQNGLKEFYSESTTLVLMPVNENARQIPPFVAAFQKWETKTADWIATNIGPFAHDHFLARPQPTAFAGQGYANMRGTVFTWRDCATNEYECYRARLEMDRANLLSILANEKYKD